MKKSLPVILLSLFSLNFVSAYYYSGFSLSDLLGSIDSSTMLLGVVFIVTFAVANYALSKAFKGNKAVSGVSSLALSILVIWEVNRRGWSSNLEYMLYDFGIPEGILETLLPLVIVGVLILLIVKGKLKLGSTLIVIGSLLLVLVLFTDVIYATGLVALIAIVCIVLGIWFSRDKDAIAKRNAEKKYKNAADNSFWRFMNKN